MPVILVAEEDAGSAEQIATVLRSEGWRIETVPSRHEALRAAAARQPALLLASATLSEAPSLLAAFSRHRGGPGAIALVDRAAAARAKAEDYQADDLVAKPCSPEVLVGTVRRYLPSAPSAAGAPIVEPPAAASHGGQQLTSADIFGDVLAEVEAEAQREKSARRVRTRTRHAQAEEIERKLEETLSGVIPAEDRRKRAAAALAAPAAGAPQDPRPAQRPQPASDEIDDLLDKTLSSLDLSSRRGRPGSKRPKIASTRSASAPKPAAPAVPPPLDAARPAAAPPSAVRPPTPAASEPVAESPPDVAPPEPVAAPPAFELPPDARPVSPAPASSSPARVADSLKTQRLPVFPIDPGKAIAPAATERSAEQHTAERRTAERRTAERRIAERGESADGKTFGEYTLLERVAVGGMAEVWRARRRGVEGFQKTVAIKKILVHLIDSPDFVNMFIDEAKLAAQLNHHNIIQIYDLGKVDDDFFIAMEYVDGKDLRSILNAAKETGQPPPMGLALLIASALARALDYAHRKRDFDDRELDLVHRDVSPQNVLISYEGEIKLCDFGIVKAVSKASTTQMGALKGKLQYMSPEQAWGRSVDARSDIFSLGSVLFEVLTGTKLFAGDSEIGVLDAVRECRVRSPREIVPAIPDSVERIVFKALTKSPEDRYQTAGEMEHDLKAVLDDIKPTPSLKDLAAYLDSLFRPPLAGAPAVEAPEDGSGPPAPATPTPAGRPPEVWKAPAVEPEGWTPEAWTADVQDLPSPAAAGTPDRGTPDRGTPDRGTPDRGTPDRGTPDRRGGRRWLVAAAAVLAVVVLAGAGWMLLLRPPDRGTPDRGTPDRGATSSPAISPPATAAGAPPAGGTAAPEPAVDGVPGDDAAAGAPFPADLEEMVAEEVLKRREQMERDFEAKKRLLEEEIERAKEAAEPSPQTPAAEAEEGGGGGGRR